LRRGSRPVGFRRRTGASERAGTPRGPVTTSPLSATALGARGVPPRDARPVSEHGTRGRFVPLARSSSVAPLRLRCECPRKSRDPRRFLGHLEGCRRCKDAAIDALRRALGPLPPGGSRSRVAERGIVRSPDGLRLPHTPRGVRIAPQGEDGSHPPRTGAPDL